MLKSVGQSRARGNRRKDLWTFLQSVISMTSFEQDGPAALVLRLVSCPFPSAFDLLCSRPESATRASADPIPTAGRTSQAMTCFGVARWFFVVCRVPSNPPVPPTTCPATKNFTWRPQCPAATRWQWRIHPQDGHARRPLQPGLWSAFLPLFHARQ